MNSAKSNSTGSQKAPASYKDLASIEFYKNELVSYRTRITKVNEEKYVALSKFWYEPKSSKWIPTKKHFFIPAKIWPSFFASVNEVNAALLTTDVKSMLFLVTFIYLHFEIALCVSIFSNSI